MRFFAFLLFVCTLPASEWTQFRGPNGAGTSSDSGLPTEFGPNKNVVWKTVLPKGK